MERSITKEQLFANLKELIETLRSPNIENVTIQTKWMEKRQQVNEEFLTLSKEDLEWIKVQYREWHKKNIDPSLNVAQRIGLTFE